MSSCFSIPFTKIKTHAFLLQLNYNKVVKSTAGQAASTSFKKGKGKKFNKRIFNQPKSAFFDKKKTKKN